MNEHEKNERVRRLMDAALNASPVERQPEYKEFDGRKIEWVIIEECDDLADLSDEYRVPSIPKLIAKLAFRMTLVIALAVGVLAVIS